MAFDLIQHSPMSMQISTLAKDPMHSCGSTSSEQSEDDDSSQATH
ncbi:Cdc25E, partial [Brachionus plicatilis]